MRIFMAGEPKLGGPDKLRHLGTVAGAWAALRSTRAVRLRR